MYPLQCHVRPACFSMTATSISVYRLSSNCPLPSLPVRIIFSCGCLVPAVSLVMLIIFPLASVVYCFLLGDCVKIVVFIPLVQNCCKVVLQLEEMLPNGLFTASSKILLAVRTPLPISIALPSNQCHDRRHHISSGSQP